MIQAVIFDMDGTLFDTERLTVEGWQEMMRRGMLPPDFLNWTPGWRGKNRDDIRCHMRELYGENFDTEKIFDGRRSILNEMIERDGLPLKPGVPSIFESIRSMGIPMALATATTRVTVDNYMRKTGYGVYFDRIVTGDTVPNGKPAPDIFLSAAEQLGVHPNNCLVIEDSPNGVRAGVAAGMYVVMVPDLEEPSEEIREQIWKVCKTLDEVPALVEAENKSNMKGDLI